LQFASTLIFEYSTKWWDPIGNTCLCTSTECQYKDTAVPVNRTANGNGIAANGSGSSNDANSIMHNQLENTFVIIIALIASILFSTYM
jgi:hypothetical protein